MALKTTFFAALLCICLTGFASAQTYTFQTSPATGEYLTTAAALVVRWENRAGNSPDSPGVTTPAQVSVYLGFRDGQNPKVLFPALNGLTSNVPTAGGSFIWQNMDFNSFQNGPAPARDANTDWFIQISDQSTGYKSNGQLFKILDGGAGASSGAPAATSGASTASAGSPATSGAAPTASGPPVVPTGSGAPSQTSSSAPSSSTKAGAPNPSGTQTAPAGSGANSGVSQGSFGSSQTGTPAPSQSASKASTSFTSTLIVAPLVLSQLIVRFL